MEKGYSCIFFFTIKSVIIELFGVGLGKRPPCYNFIAFKTRHAPEGKALFKGWREGSALL